MVIAWFTEPIGLWNQVISGEPQGFFRRGSVNFKGHVDRDSRNHDEHSTKAENDSLSHQIHRFIRSVAQIWS